MKLFKRLLAKNYAEYFISEKLISEVDNNFILNTIENIEFKRAHQYSEGRHNKEIFTSNSQIEDILDVVLLGFKFKNLKLVQYSKPHEFYKYDCQDYILPHSDAPREFDNSNKSNYTLIIYLNDNFIGGETFFVGSNIKITPQKNAGLFFKHSLVHEALPVVAGVKYVFRTNCLLV